MTQNFVKLVMISFMVATRIRSYLMNQWLQDYEYKTEITWEIFFMSGGLALTIALLTISYQAIRAALVSPVKSLRAE